MTRNFTSGKPLKLIVSFAFPLMLANVFQLFYNLTDSVILGRFVSSDALAAVGVTGPISSLLIGFAMGVTNGFSIPVAQSFGAGNAKMVKKYYGNALTLTLIIAVIITFAAVTASRPLLRLINTPDTIIESANTYALIMYSGVVFTMFYNLFAGMMRALGDSRAPLLFLFVSSVLNILLDLLFVVNFNLQVEGAAIASVISKALSVVMCIFYIRKKHKELDISKGDLTLSSDIVKNLLSMGIPMALQLSITGIGSLVLQGAVNGFGADAVAAVSVGSKVENIVNIVLSGLGVSLSTFAAQNKGAGKYGRVFKATAQTFALDASLSVGASVILYFFGRTICTLFVGSNEEALLGFSDRYLKTLAIFYVTLSVLFIFRNVLQGLGFAYTSIIAGASELVGRFLVAYVFSRFFGFGAICMAGPLAWMAADIPLVIIYFVKRNKIKKSLIKCDTVSA